MVVSKCLYEFFSSSLLSKRRCLLKLIILSSKALVKLRQFYFHVVLAIFLLISHNLEYFVLELLLSLHLKFLKLVKH